RPEAKPLPSDSPLTTPLTVTLPAPVTTRLEVCRLRLLFRFNVPASAPMAAVGVVALRNTWPVRVLLPLRFLRAPEPSGPDPARITLTGTEIPPARPRPPPGLTTAPIPAVDGPRAVLLAATSRPALIVVWPR